MATALDVITRTLRLFNVIDQTETPTPDDVANNVPILNEMLRAEHADAAAQYLMSLVSAVLPRAVPNARVPYTFVVGPSGAVKVDAVGIRAIYLNDTSSAVNRETRVAPKADVVRTTFPGIITKWHQERQPDGSILVTAWQPPRLDTRALIDCGLRLPLISAADGSDVIGLPPEGIHDATLMLGRRIMSSYGKTADSVGVLAQDAEAVNTKWKTWARGAQWVRMVRA